MTDAPLFTIDDREIVPGPHVLLPNMSYACGGNILTKQGGFTVGASDWNRVGCPDCRALGKDALIAESRAQQTHQEPAA